MTTRRRPARRRRVPAAGGSWWPSRKWWAATALAAGTVATAWATAGHWTGTLTITAIGFAVQRFTAWMLPNAKADA